MASTWLSLLVVVHVIAHVIGIQQELTFYTESNQGGDAITFRSSKSDLSDYSIVTNNTKSYCVTGFWFTFKRKDFEEVGESFGNINEQTNCGNYTGGIFNSIRHFGASDTLTEALSLYEGTNASGREHLVTGLASNNFGFNPIRYISSGKTVWTLFEGSNFDGNSTCSPLGQYNLYYGNISPLQAVRSVVKGCGAEAERNVAN